MSLTPISTPGAFLDVQVAGRPFPGRIIKGGIRGLKNVDEWSTVRPIAGTGWTQIYKGRQPIKGIEVEVSLNAATPALEDAAWAAHYKFIPHIRGAAPPKPATNRALAVRGAVFKGAGVLSLVCAGWDEPIFDTGNLRVIYRFDEATKSKLFPIGPPEAAILNDTNPIPGSRNEALLASMAAASTGLPVLVGTYPGINAGVPTE